VVEAPVARGINKAVKLEGARRTIRITLMAAHTALHYFNSDPGFAVGMVYKFKI
jgi:hypothetical protein